MSGSTDIVAAVCDVGAPVRLKRTAQIVRRLLGATRRQSDGRLSDAGRPLSELAWARSAFTLIEILVVIVVLGVLATLVAPNVFRHVGSAKDAAARSQIELLGAALDAYRLDNGAYPTTEQGLEALRREPVIHPEPANWRGPYLRKEVPADPWKSAYVYRSPGEANPWGFDLLSYGADGRAGGEDEARDITSWE